MNYLPPPLWLAHPLQTASGLSPERTKLMNNSYRDTKADHIDTASDLLIAAAKALLAQTGHDAFVIQIPGLPEATWIAVGNAPDIIKLIVNKGDKKWTERR